MSKACRQLLKTVMLMTPRAAAPHTQHAHFDQLVVVMVVVGANGYYCLSMINPQVSGDSGQENTLQYCIS